MGSAEIGTTDLIESDHISNLLMINREIALEDAQARAERVVLGFRKAKIFERTFRTKLESYNTLIGFSEIAEGGFVPVGYFDPHADLASQPNNN